MIKLSVCIPVWNQETLVIRALEHIPHRDDIEILVRDDGSTDNTLKNLTAYKQQHPEINLNRLLEDAQGEYFHAHNSDDYVVTNEYNRLIDRLGDMDVLGFSLQINDGTVWHLDESTNRIHCAQAIRFIRKSFVEGITYNEEMKAASDWYYNEDMLKRNPKIVYDSAVVYMYNFPREGSLVDLRARGLIGE